MEVEAALESAMHRHAGEQPPPDRCWRRHRTTPAEEGALDTISGVSEQDQLAFEYQFALALELQQSEFAAAHRRRAPTWGP